MEKENRNDFKMRNWVRCPVCGESDMPEYNGVITCLNESCPTNTGEFYFELKPLSESVLSDNEERAKRYIEEEETHIFPIDTYVLFAMIAEIRYHRSKES